jgi:hypothetical protein
MQEETHLNISRLILQTRTEQVSPPDETPQQEYSVIVLAERSMLLPGRSTNTPY